MTVSSKNDQTETAVSCCPLKYLLDIFLVGFLEHCIHEQVLEGKQRNARSNPLEKLLFLTILKHGVACNISEPIWASLLAMFGSGMSNNYNFALALQRIERGEIIDSGYEGLFRVRADGKDEISSLPRNVALRVRPVSMFMHSHTCNQHALTWHL